MEHIKDTKEVFQVLNEAAAESLVSAIWLLKERGETNMIFLRFCPEQRNLLEWPINIEISCH